MFKIKLAFLTSMLALVLYGLYSLNTGQIDFSFITDSSKLNWCATRVIEVAEENTVVSYRIFQKNLEWLVQRDNKTITLPKTAMEKWLGEHCQIKLDTKLSAPQTPLERLGLVKVRLLNGQTFVFERFPGGVHRFEGSWFKSNEWDLALSRLGTLGLPEGG